MESHHTYLKSAYVHYAKGDATNVNVTDNNTVNENEYQENEIPVTQVRGWLGIPSQVTCRLLHVIQKRY